MIIITPSPVRKSRLRGMTLVELLVTTTLGGIIMTGVLTVYLMVGRTAVNVANYIDMEGQSRTSLEVFAQDIRQASSITWSSSTKIKLVVNSVAVTYEYDTSNASNKTFTRTTGGRTETLITKITSFSFIGYKLDGSTVSLADLTSAGKSTKQIQLSLKAQRIDRTAAATSNTVLSARFILRNKIITS